MIATHEFVVPKSIPITLAIVILLAELYKNNMGPFFD